MPILGIKKKKILTSPTFLTLTKDLPNIPIEGGLEYITERKWRYRGKSCVCSYVRIEPDLI